MIRQITTQADLEELTSYVTPLIGQSCWLVRPAYGQTLHLHIGDEIIGGHESYQHSDLPEIRRESLLSSEGTEARIMHAGQCLFTTANDDEWDHAQHTLRVLEARPILDVKIGYEDLSLVVTFDHSYSLAILPTSEDDEEDVSYWDLLNTAEQKVLEVGPNRLWSYLPSDKPRF